MQIRGSTFRYVLKTIDFCNNYFDSLIGKILYIKYESNVDGICIS